MTLFKEGSLTAIDESEVADYEMLLHCDKDSRTLIDWLNINKKQAVLNHLYQKKIIFFSANLNGLDVRKSGEFKMQILHWAVLFNQSIEVINQLIEQGADINALSFHGSALTIAADRGYLEIVKYFSKLPNINLNAVSELSGNSALIMSAFNGHLEIVQYLSVIPGIALNARGLYGYTALIMAAFRGHLEIVKYLSMLSSIDLNAMGVFGRTALSVAAQSGYLKMVEHLSALPGIHLNAGEDGCTALVAATKENHLATVKHLAAQPQLVLEHFTNAQSISDKKIQQVIESEVKDFIQKNHNKNFLLAPLINYFINYKDKKASFGLFSSGPDFEVYLFAHMVIIQSNSVSNAWLANMKALLQREEVNARLPADFKNMLLQINGPQCQMAEEKLAEEQKTP